MMPVSITGVRGTLVITLSTVLLAAGAAGCETTPPEPNGPISADTYVAVMSGLADLKRFPLPGPDYVTRTARADSARQAILDRHGVTVDELLAYAEQLGSHPNRMLAVTDQIIIVTDSLARQHRDPDADRAGVDSATAGPGGDARRDTSVRPEPTVVDTALHRLKLERLRERFDSNKRQP